MEQRIALYYPHTTIRDESALKRALLLWDKIEVIVPHEHYDFSWDDGRYTAEAMELFGSRRIPTPVEQREAHNAIDDLTSHGIPALRLRPDDHGYQVYPEKFMHETWLLLQRRRLRRPEMEDGDYVVSENTGLIIMSVLAQVLAGESRALYTDRASSYEALWATLSGSDWRPPHPGDDVVIPVALGCVNLDDIPLARAVGLRKREETPGGASLRTLRHNLQEFTSKKASELAKLASSPTFKPADALEFTRQMESEVREDANALRQELGAALTQTIFSKDLLTPLVFGASAGASLYSVIPPALSGAAAIVAFGGVAALRSKYLQQRIEIQKKHPSSYALALRPGFL